MRNAEQIMFSIKKWIFRPKKSDNSQLAQFFYADEELNLVAAELDSFDGRKDPERCTALVNQLRLCQDKVLTIIEKIMCEVIPTQRANRDFRVKFPDDVLQESLAGQLWFGAECLAAGSSIMNREVESASMRPLAKALTRHLDFLRSSLRDQCLKNQNSYTDKITNTLMVFDRLFAEFELSYVSAMVPVKTMKEYDLLQEVAVLFCETVQRATRLKLLTQNQIDDYDPALMFTIPRLAIVSGLLVYPEGPLNPDMDPMNMSEMFRPFQTLLYKIRELLWTLSREELWLLEKSLCSTDDPSFNARLTVEDKLNSINSDCDSNQGLSLRSDNQVEEGSVYSGESCVMSHSVSTNTIVSHADAASNDMDSSSQFSRVDESPAERDSASEDSSQEDDASDDHLQDEAGCSSVGTRRLRHSQSWPEASKRPARNRRLPPEGDTLENDCGSSMEILEDIGVEHQPLARCTHSTGSREFCFHLPRNTGQDTGPTAAFPAIPSSTEASSGQTSQQIIITEESVLSQDSEHHEDGHISFVTDALNQVFLTDPNFKGVLVSDWNQRPPRCSRESCTKSCDENCKGGFQCPNTESEERGASPPNVAQGGDEVCSDNCDKCSSSCNKRSPCRSSASDAVQKGKALKRESADPSEKEINKNCKRRSRKARLVDYENKPNTDSLAVPKLHRGKPSEQLNSSRSHSPSVDYDWDRESYSSSETSSYNSDSHDDEEIALAIQAAELAARQEARGRFKSSSDLIHRLFVCISGVADQLQTNYASDLRHILKTVFDCAASETLDEVEEANEKTCADVADMSDSTDSDDDEYVTEEDGNQNRHHNSTSETDPPEWMPDGESPHCMACKVPFTFVRRRHHCRNCGKIFCGRCSSNSVPLPHYGHSKPVRICNHCYVFQVTPFTVN